MNVYEIYTKNPITGEGGWDIKFVEAESREQVKSFPHFDDIITVNDYLSGAPLWNMHGAVRLG